MASTPPEHSHMDSETERMLAVVEACSRCRCGCCKDQCPMYSELLEESIAPKGRNALIGAVAKGAVEPDERTMRIAYACLLCRRDETTCTAALKNAEANETFRRMLVDKGVAPLPAHDAVMKSLSNYGNPWQEPKVSRKKWARNLKGRRFTKGQHGTLLFVGCTAGLDRNLWEGPRALARLMDLADERWGTLLDDEVCCGSTAKRIGQEKMFQRLRDENVRTIHEIGARRVVVPCAGCFKTFKQDYGELLKDVEVLHSSEYLLQTIKERRLRLPPVEIKVTYHDPCHMGRHLGMYDVPRAVLKSVKGLRLVEMKNNRDKANCCGGGAGVKTAYPEVTSKVALKRLKEAEATGAGILVTTCPFCVQTLSAAKEQSRSPMEIVDLPVLLERIITGTIE